MTKRRNVVNARGDSEGDVTHVLLEGNTRYTPVNQAIGMADRGELANVHAVHPVGRNPYLRTHPNGSTADNLDTMVGDN